MSFHLGNIRVCHSFWPSQSRRRTSPRRMASRRMSPRRMFPRRRKVETDDTETDGTETDVPETDVPETEEGRDGCPRDGWRLDGCTRDGGRRRRRRQMSPTRKVCCCSFANLWRAWVDLTDWLCLSGVYGSSDVWVLLMIAVVCVGGCKWVREEDRMAERACFFVRYSFDYWIVCSLFMKFLGNRMFVFSLFLLFVLISSL